MSEDNTIEIAAIQETDFGEKAVIDSPYESKEHISNLPWNEYQEEIDEHGSLREKAKSRGQNVKTSELIDVFDAMETFGFSPDFGTHVSWEPDALGGGGAWTIDKDAVDEAADFWEFCGYNVEITADL